MNRATQLIAVGLLGLLAACGKGQNPDKSSRRTLPTNYVEGSFVVTADVTTSETQLAQAAAAAGDALGCSVAKPDRINWGDQSLDASGVLSEQMLNTFNVKYGGCDFSREGTKAILGKLAADSMVLNVEAEAVAAASPISEDDTMKKYEDHLGLIKRDKACALAEKSGEPVIVAVVDSGVFTEHPDLKDSILRNANGEIVGANFVGSGAQMPPDQDFEDQNGHGTHVAGLIGATANNGQGVVGVGACANVKIMPVRVMNEKGKGSSIEIERGVKWAADHGAQIINLSLGFTADLSGSGRDFYRSIYAEMAQRDVIVFAAAGNDGYVNGSADPDQTGAVRYDFPASYDNVISVAATNSSGVLASFSNRGPRVDIAAPGYAVLSTLKSGDYGRMSGTSMATPVAAGAYALALATARAGLGNLDRVDAKVAEAIIKGSIGESGSLSSDEVDAGGVIDVEKMVAAMKAKYPKAAPAAAPVEPAATQPPATPPATSPAQPIVSQPEPAAAPTGGDFGFIGLAPGDKPALPQEIGVENLPQGTATVYFYWGKAYWSFAKAFVSGNATDATARGKWYLYGNRTLKAVAYSKAGRKLATIMVDLSGY